MDGQIAHTAPPSAPFTARFPSAPHPLASTWLFSSEPDTTIGVPSRLVPFLAARAANTGPHTGPGLAGSTGNQKYVMSHMPRMSAQKYPNGLLLAPFLARGVLPALPSKAVRLVAKPQTCLSPGGATVVTGNPGGSA